MPGGTKLIIGDTHGRLPDLQPLKGLFGRVDAAVCLGDLVDEYSLYSNRVAFFEKFYSDLEDVVRTHGDDGRQAPNVVVVEGNHEAKCTHYEEKYKNVDEEYLSSLRSKARLTKGEKAISAINVPAGEVRFTRELMDDIGAVGAYACISEGGKFYEEGEHWDNFQELKESPYEIYAKASHDVPGSVRENSNARALHLISHHQNVNRFRGGTTDYYHAHRHDYYQDGNKISSSIFRPVKGRRWKVDRSFEYRLVDREVEESGRHTPCVSFFLGEDGTARLELIPGIYGDWMVLDPPNRRVVYGSSITHRTTDIWVDFLFDKVCREADVSGYKLVI